MGGLSWSVYNEVYEETAVGCIVVRAAVELVAKYSISFDWPE